MRTCVFIPPLARHAGGVAVLLDVARHLHGAGYEVILTLREPPGTESAHALPQDIPAISWEEIAGLSLSATDIWLTPEGWVNAMLPGLQAGATCLVYCQNWSYLFSSLPENVAWSQLPASFLAVSKPVAWFVEETTGRPAPVLRPGIDLQRFAPPGAKPAGPLRVAYMPRKNKALVQRVREIVASRAGCGIGPFADGQGLEWVEISGLPQDEVAARLASSHVFLASGFPEGCPLPPLEAMASGCLPVGFSGFGGWDYMRQIAPELPFAAGPWWPERPDTSANASAIKGNGIWVADADVMAAALAIEECQRMRRENAPLWQQGTENAIATARCYSLELQAERVQELWRGFEKQLAAK